MNSRTFIFSSVAVIILNLVNSTCASGQKNVKATPKGPIHLHIRLLAKSYEDSIVIRWAPENAVAWLLGKDSGYRVVRIDYDDPQHPVSHPLTTAAFRPMSLDQMKANLGHDDKYAAIAAQALYGNNFSMTRQEPTAFAKKIKQEHDVLSFRYSFAMEAADFSAPVANALALRWVDKDVKKGQRYIYVITAAGGNKNYVIDSAATFIANNKEQSMPSPEGLEAYGFDRQVELHWHRRQTGNFSAYFIERSEDEGVSFRALNKLPYYSPDQPPALQKSDSNERKIASLLRDHQVYMDSIPQDYKTYYYRVRGINAFAELSAYSTVVKVQGRDLTAPVAPVIDSAVNTIGSQIKITWKQHTASPDLAGYYISRGNSVKGPFHPITRTLLAKNTRSFVDSAAAPHLPNYYVVMAMDTARNVSASGAFVGYLTDTTAPAAPQGVGGTIDSAGVVHLHWSAGKESDIKGYKVYYAYNPHYEFSQITKEELTRNEFIDTISLQSLNRTIYYKVVALDQSNNHSAYSEAAALKKIVVVPPSAPVAGIINVKGRKVVIEWIESRSEGAVGYEVLRKGAGNDWKPVTRLHQDWNARSLSFADTTIALNTDYYYTASTIDSTGSRSDESFPVHIRSNGIDSAAGLVDLNAAWNSKEHKMQLNWQYKDTGDYFFVVYRSYNHGPLDPWQSFESGTQSASDVKMNAGTYGYAIKVVHRDQTNLSGIGKTHFINVIDK